MKVSFTGFEKTLDFTNVFTAINRSDDDTMMSRPSCPTPHHLTALRNTYTAYIFIHNMNIWSQYDWMSCIQSCCKSPDIHTLKKATTFFSHSQVTLFFKNLSIHPSLSRSLSLTVNGSVSGILSLLSLTPFVLVESWLCSRHVTHVLLFLFNAAAGMRAVIRLWGRVTFSEYVFVSMTLYISNTDTDRM